MGALSKLMGRQGTSLQALVKAPSADLIKSDEAPKLPEMVEIKCKLSPEELARYIDQINNAEYQNFGLKTERLRHLLKKQGNKQYTRNDIDKFAKKSREYFHKKDGAEYINIPSWFYEDDHVFIPPRIINKINGIRTSFVHPDDLEFTVIGFRKIYYHTKPPSFEFFLGIFFLKVKIKEKRIPDYIPDDDDMVGFIIDAWRGPTFSDEEARLP